LWRRILQWLGSGLIVTASLLFITTLLHKS
jgi:hypothetical protein